MYSKTATGIVQGISAQIILVETDVSDGMPYFELIGFLSAEVREARERVKSGLKNSGILLPPKKITVNLSPAYIRKSGTGFDLPIAVALLSAMGKLSERKQNGILVVGEVGLNGRILPVSGILPIVSAAKAKGYTSCMVPFENLSEAKLVRDIEVVGVKNLSEVIEFFNMEGNWESKEEGKLEPVEKEMNQLPDFADINGQESVKRACEVAAAGMHNLLLIGPPGAGKTMIASRIPTILPKLNEEEMLELSKIYSVNGMLAQRAGRMGQRPFRNPHHTITPQGLVGGGRIPHPGEVSLAHRGILFLDEFAEFPSQTLEILRQPMEDKEVNLVRLAGTCTYPADFMLVAAMNPCGCGYYPDYEKCRCTELSIRRYLGRISGPLLDRIDISTEAASLDFDTVANRRKNESSEQIRRRVKTAHEIQKKRYQTMGIYTNAQLSANEIEKVCKLSPALLEKMGHIYKRLELSMRSYHKILKVARTIADLEGEEIISESHLNEAVMYRSIDKKYWER